MSKGKKAKPINGGNHGKALVNINGGGGTLQAAGAARIKGEQAMANGHCNNNNNCNGNNEQSRRSSRAASIVALEKPVMSPMPSEHKARRLVSRWKLAQICGWLVFALYCRYRLFYSSWDDDELEFSGGHAKHPLALVTYAKFQATFPRFRKATKVEDTRRQLLFMMDLLMVGEQILAKVARHYEQQQQEQQPQQQQADDKWARQSPFKSDRTLDEQLDVLSQLEEFNVTQIISVLDIRQPVVVGAGGAADSSFQQLPVSGVEVEKGNQFQRWLMRNVKSDSHYEIPHFPLDEQPDPERITHIDADLRHCSSKIYHQGSCGACYAFSWNSLAEWHYCRQSGARDISFSEQHLVDCGELAGLHGCKEGLLPSAKEFTQKFGFYLSDEYPYKGKQKSCKEPRGSVQVNVAEFKRVKVDREEWERILEEQPILLEVLLPADVMSYQRGVHPGTNCDPRKAHGMLLVGHGRQEGRPYWILKNSQGKQWGENGYLRLSRDAPMSQCFRTGFVAKFKFKSLDEDSYHDFYDNLSYEPEEQQVPRLAANKGALDHWFKE